MIGLLIYITEIIKDEIVFKYYLNKRLNRIWVALVALCLYYVWIQFGVLEIFCVQIAGLCVLFMMTEGRKPKLGSIVLIYLLLEGMNELLIAIFKGISNAGHPGKEIYFWLYLLSNVISMIVLLLVLAVKKYNRLRAESINIAVVYGILAFVVMSIYVTISLLQYISGEIEDAFVLKLMNILAIISFFGILVLLFVVFYIYRMNEKINDSYKMEKEMQKMQKIYYESLLEKENETRKYRHDMINHMICLKSLAEKANREETCSYIEGLCGGIENIQSKAYVTGNEILDIMLNYYIQGVLKPVEVKVSGMIDRKISAEYMQQCVIFSNLIKNAVEEIQEQDMEQSFLHIKIFPQEENLKLIIKNSSRKKLIKNGKAATTKEDKKNHGIGMENIKREIEKCGGSYQAEYENGVFQTTVVFKCE